MRSPSPLPSKEERDSKIRGITRGCDVTLDRATIFLVGLALNSVHLAYVLFILGYTTLF
jgi:hypothetical protein